MPETPAEKSLRRVLVISALDGWSVSLFAGLCTLISLASSEWLGVYIGCVITGCGILELRGRKQLKRGDASGMKWLVRSQAFVLTTILLYAAQNMVAYDEELLLSGMTPDMLQALDQLGITIDQFRPLIKPVYFAIYATVIGLTLLFQGGLALYYQTRRGKVAQALAERAPQPQVAC